MKIGIFGAGAVGCYLGGRLVACREDVLVLGRPRACEEMSRVGLRLVGLDGAEVTLAPTKVRCTSDVEALADRDAVLVCVKSGQTDEAARALAILPRSVTFVSMQNGIRNADVLRAGLPAHRVLAGIVGFNVVATPDGAFRQGTTGWLVLEDDGRAGAFELGVTLRGAGLEARLAKDVRALQWSKLAMNLNNAVGALGDVATPRMIGDPGYRWIVRAIVGEALAVFRAAGVRPARFGALPLGALPFVLGLPTPLLRFVARAQLRMDPEARSSMWQDLARRRLTEVDELNGEIVRLAASCGARAPVNEAVVALVHAAEQRGDGSPKLSAEALARALGLSSMR